MVKKSNNCFVTTSTVWIMLILGLIFGLAFLGLSPPMTAPDELGHFAKAYGGATGQFFPERIPPQDKEQENVVAPREWGGDVPIELVNLYDIAALGFGKADVKFPWGQLAQTQNSGTEVFSSWGAIVRFVESNPSDFRQSTHEFFTRNSPGIHFNRR